MQEGSNFVKMHGVGGGKKGYKNASVVIYEQPQRTKDFSR